MKPSKTGQLGQSAVPQKCQSTERGGRRGGEAKTKLAGEKRKYTRRKDERRREEQASNKEPEDSDSDAPAAPEKSTHQLSKLDRKAQQKLV